MERLPLQFETFAAGLWARVSPWLDHAWSRVLGWWEFSGNFAGEKASQWGERLAFLWEDPFLLIAFLVVALLFSNLVLLFFTFSLRTVYYFRDKHRQAMHDTWNRLVPGFIAGEETLEEIRRNVAAKDMRLFGAYVRPFLLDIEGKDRDRLLALMEVLDYTGFLRKMLSHRSEWTRSFAVHFLGVIKDGETAVLVRPLLRDRSELVRYAASEALMQLQDTPSVPVILKDLSRTTKDRRDRVSSLLAEFGRGILPVLHKLLEAPWAPDWLRVLMINLIGDYVYIEATWDILRTATQTGDRDVFIACLRALGEFEDSTLVGFFEDHLHHDDPVARGVAARALGRIGELRHLEPLVEMLRQNEFWVLREAVNAMLEYGPDGQATLLAAYRVGRVSPLAARLIREALPDMAGSSS